MDDLCGHQPGHHPGPFSREVKPQGGRRAAPAVKEAKAGKQLQNGGKKLLFLHWPQGQRGGQPPFIGGHHRGALSQHCPPPGGLHGVAQLVFCHPLLAGEGVLLIKELHRPVPAQVGQNGPLGQLQLIGGALQSQPGQVVQQRLSPVPRPGLKEPGRPLLPVPLADTAHNGV